MCHIQYLGVLAFLFAVSGCGGKDEVQNLRTKALEQHARITELEKDVEYLKNAADFTFTLGQENAKRRVRLEEIVTGLEISVVRLEEDNKRLAKELNHLQ